MLRESIGWRPRMLLNILQGTEQPPPTMIWSKMEIMQQLGSPVLKTHTIIIKHMNDKYIKMQPSLNTFLVSFFYKM